MPRRKYGHMVGNCPPTPQEKCRACRLGHPCNVHDPDNAPDYEVLAKKKRKRFSGRKRGKKRISRGAVEKKRLKNKND
jgi:hypothetical protein